LTARRKLERPAVCPALGALKPRMAVERAPMLRARAGDTDAPFSLANACERVSRFLARELKLEDLATCC
jgi:hypothetical protein